MNIQDIRIGHSPLTNRIYAFIPRKDGSAASKKDVTNDVLFAHREHLLARVKQSKIDNAAASRAKAKANGNKTGRKRMRPDAKICKLRKEGLSMRKIAEACGVSTTAVQRSLKEEAK